MIDAAPSMQATGMGGISSQQIAMLANNYKLTPATLMAEVAPWWIPAPFLQYLGAEIASAIARGNCGLLVSAPPRHGKSKLITVATPLWVLENFPTKNVIVATYGEDLSTDFTREVKDLIKANQDKLSLRVRRDVDRAANFLTPQGGGLKAVGLRGTITGRGAHVLIIDDYIKEPKEALNHMYLESLKTWYATVARTRLEPGAVVIIVATRWVVNDLHGHIERLELRRRRPFYRIIKIPAIAGVKNKETGKWEQGITPDILGRAPGQPLFAQRYNVEQLEDIIDELGSRWFEAMFQQNPLGEGAQVADTGNLRIISKEEYNLILKRGDNTPGRFKHRRAWDLASTKTAGDFTAGITGTYDTHEDVIYYTGLLHEQMSAAAVEKSMKDCAVLDREGTETVIEQEPGSAGTFSVMHFKDLYPKGHKVHILKSTNEGSKLLKAQPMLAALENKKIYLVVDDPQDLPASPWVAKFIDELVTFPEGGHDDIVDAACSLYNQVTGRRFKGGSFGRSDKEKKELAAQGRSPDGAKKSSTTFGRGYTTQKTQPKRRRAFMGFSR